MSPPATVTSSPTHTKVSGYRRNGKLRSCEPCRKSKLRCDHAVPVCGRCIARRRGDRCVYHPNPLTRGAEYTAVGDERVEQRPERSSLSPNVPSDPAPPNEASSIEPEDQASEEHFEQVPTEPSLQATNEPTRSEFATATPSLDAASSRNAQDGLGFVGATSFSSILTVGLGDIQKAFPNAKALSQKDSTVPDNLINHGCQTLAFFVNKTMIDHCIEQWYTKSEGSFICPELFMRKWVQQLWQHNESVLSNRNPEAIWKLCQRIWSATMSPIPLVKNTTLSEWVSKGSDQSPKWQVIGLVATVVGLCATSLPTSHDLFVKHDVPRSKLMNNTLEVSQACIGFCRAINVVDDLFVWLLYEHARLLRAIKGEGCYETYRAGGETIDAIIAMGLHQNDSFTDETPFFLAELRKRLVSGACARETSTATFLGRPKRLLYLYSDINAPLDVRDEHLALRGSELATLLTSLHPDGFNKDGRLYRTTWLRAWLPFDQIREEILDLALGRHEREDILRRAASIQNRSEQHWRRLPAFMREAVSNLTRNRTLPPLEVLYRAILRQDYQSNELLLQRVLVAKTGSTSENLISVAQSILRDVLLLTQRHDIGTMLEMDFVFLLIMYGLRSAATLAVELLKQEQVRPSLNGSLLPRSRTIQDLSVFAARLGAVDPFNEGFRVCEQGRKAIVFILDQILSPVAAIGQRACSLNMPTPQIDGDVTMSQPLEAASDLGSGNMATANLDQTLEFGTITLGRDHDFMQWLENVNWDEFTL